VRAVRFLLALVAVGCIPHVALAAWPCCCPWGSCGASGGEASVVPVANQTAYKSPTVIAKMGYGTKKLMTNTKNLLTFNKSADNQNTMTAGYSTRTKHKEPGFFYKLFHPEPPAPPQTVKEWMSLEQIHP
jgi:hypothetical protein